MPEQTDAKPTIVLVHGSTRRAGAGTVEIEGSRVIMGEHDRCEPGVRTRRSARSNRLRRPLMSVGYAEAGKSRKR